MMQLAALHPNSMELIGTRELRGIEDFIPAMDAFTAANEGTHYVTMPETDSAWSEALIYDQDNEVVLFFVLVDQIS